MSKKRIFSLILAAALMLSLLAAGATVGATAEISVVDLSGFHMSPGQSLPETLTTGEYGTVSSVSWEKWNYTANAWEAYSGEIVGATAYRLTALIDPAEGYSFSYGCEYTIDSGDVMGRAYRSGSSVEVVHVFPVGVQLLSSVTVDTVPEIKTGDDPAEAASQLKLAPGENCTIAATDWFYRTAPFVASYESFEGAFPARADYKLYIDLAPMPGYWFGDDVAVQADHYGDSFRSDDAFWVITLLYETSERVENIEVTVTGVGKGNNIEDVTVAVAEDAPYQIDMVEVLNSDYDTVTGVFGNNRYQVNVYLGPVGDYRFSEATKFFANGEMVGIGCPLYDFACVRYVVDYRTPIEEVNVSVTGVEPGKNAADVQVTVAEDAPYTLVHLDILDYKEDVFDGAFDAAEYYTEIYLEPKEGYCFTDDTVAFVNGTSLATYYNENRNYLNIELHEDFRTAIDKVDITLAKPSHATDAAQAIAGVTVSETANYALKQVSILDSSGNAAQGLLTESDYRYQITLKAKDGYCMNADAVEVYINGVKAENFSVANYGFDLQVSADYNLCDYTATVTPPTCTADGYTTYACSCGTGYMDNFVPATGHNPGAAATCTSAQICTVCSATLADPLGHSYADGVCSRCGRENPAVSGCIHNFTDDGFTSDFFTIVGSPLTNGKHGTYTYDFGCGTEILSYAQRFDSSGSVSFTAPSNGKLTIAAAASSANRRLGIYDANYTEISVLDIPNAKTLYVLTVDVLANETYTVKRNSGESGLYYIAYMPNAPAAPSLQKGEDGNYYYYVDGEIATDFIGLVENSAGRWYIKNGQAQLSYDGLVTFEGTKYLIKAGHVNTAFTGITKQEGVYYYFTAGVNDLEYEGLVYCNGMKAYVQDGEVNFNKTGIVEDEGKLVYVKYGIWRNTFKGLARTDDGKWIYMANGTFDATYTGVAKLNANWVYVNAGYVDSSYSGTVTVNGVDYTVKYGVVQF